MANDVIVCKNIKESDHGGKVGNLSDLQQQNKGKAAKRHRIEKFSPVLSEMQTGKSYQCGKYEGKRCQRSGRSIKSHNQISGASPSAGKTAYPTFIQSRTLRRRATLIFTGALCVFISTIFIYGRKNNGAFKRK